MQNPYESSDVTDAALVQEPRDKSKIAIARLSWQLPLACLGASIVINAVARPVGFVGGLIFMGGVVVGFVLAVVALFMALKHRGVLGHAIAGLIVNILLSLLVVAAIVAVREALEAQKRQPRDRQINRCECLESGVRVAGFPAPFRVDGEA